MSGILDAVLDTDIRDTIGCPVQSTFFVSIAYTDFVMLHDYYLAGHEIAAHTITVRFASLSL